MSRPPIVDFLLVGAQKSGTTTLHALLKEHPGVAACKRKEPEFFSDPNWRARLHEYEALFPDPHDRLHFEASTHYTAYPRRNINIHRDLHGYNPDLKILYLVREPVSRIVSAYVHAYERGFTDLPLSQALIKNSGLLDLTRYATQITPYIEAFGRDRVHICFFDDLTTDPAGLLADVAGFLDIDPEPFAGAKAVHRNKSTGEGKKIRRHKRFDHPTPLMRAVRRHAPALWKRWAGRSSRALAEKPALSEDERRAVRHMLRHEIAELEELTGRDLSAWRGDERFHPDPSCAT